MIDCFPSPTKYPARNSDLRPGFSATKARHWHDTIYVNTIKGNMVFQNGGILECELQAHTVQVSTGI